MTPEEWFSDDALAKQAEAEKWTDVLGLLEPRTQAEEHERCLHCSGDARDGAGGDGLFCDLCLSRDRDEDYTAAELAAHRAERSAHDAEMALTTHPPQPHAGRGCRRGRTSPHPALLPSERLRTACRSAGLADLGRLPRAGFVAVRMQSKRTSPRPPPSPARPQVRPRRRRREW